MNYSLNGHCFEDDVLSVLQIFYPNQSYKLTKNDDKIGFYAVSSAGGGVLAPSFILKAIRFRAFIWNLTVRI